MKLVVVVMVMVMMVVLVNELSCLVLTSSVGTVVFRKWITGSQAGLL
jgi:hypothetical protein